MDPALWEVLAGDAADEIAALVRLHPGAASPDGVRVVARFGDIATIRLRRGDLLRVRGEVKSMKAPRELRPEPARAQASARAPKRRSLAGGPTGRGSVIGVVDWGCDFTHPNLRKANGGTRLLALWDQRGRGRAPKKYGYGAVYRSKEIDRALQEDDPFAALGYDVADGDPGGVGSHGAHVMDIAAGVPRVGPGGVAPGADLVFVELAVPAWGPKQIGNSVSLLEAIDFIAGTAGDRPWVINLSLGSHGGPHDGSTLVEQAFDAIVTSGPGRVIVQSVGNYHNRPIHTRGKLATGERAKIDWLVDPTDETVNELEVWYHGADRLDVTLIDPRGRRVVRAGPDSHGAIRVGGETIGRYAHRTGDPNNGDNQIALVVDPDAGGRWQVELEAARGGAGDYHVWIERDEVRPGSQSRLRRASSVATTTTNSISNGHHTITVGAVDADGKPAPFSSAGPTRDGRTKPDVYAPGVAIVAARSEPWNDRGGDPYLTRKSGTSMAAPHVTGAVAVLYEAAGRPLTADEVKRALTADRTLDLAAAIERVRGGDEKKPAKPEAPEMLGEALAEDVLPPGSFVVPHRRIVMSAGIIFEHADLGRAKWVGGQPLGPQVAALALSGLVPPGDFSTDLVKRSTRLIESLDWTPLNVKGNARVNEPITRMTLTAHHAYMVVVALEHYGIKVTLDDDERGRLERAVAVMIYWLRNKTKGLGLVEAYPWMTDQMLRDYVWRRRRYVDALHAALDWKKVWQGVAASFADKGGYTLRPWYDGSDPKAPRPDLGEAWDAAERQLNDAWYEAVNPYLLIRDDPDLINERGYNSLWPRLGKDKKENRTATATATDQEPHSPEELRRFLTYTEVQKPGLTKEAVRDPGQRKPLLLFFARYSSVATNEAPTGGRSGALSDAPALANAPPLPSTMSTAPVVVAPDYFIPTGAELRATMSLNFPDVFEAFLDFGYRWELVKIPADAIGKAIDRGNELGYQHTDSDAPGLWDVVANQADRRYGYAKTDVRRVFSDLDSNLGGARLGASGLVIVGSIAGFVGEVILSFFEWMAAKQNEKRIALRDPGIFLLRCIATPRPSGDAARFRPPSAAYLPLWVRPVDAVSEDEAAKLQKQWEGLPAKIDEKQKQLAEAKEELRKKKEAKSTELLKKEIAQLEEDIKQLEKDLKQLENLRKDSVAEQLERAWRELREYLDSVKIPADAEPYVKRELEEAKQQSEKRYGDLGTMLMNRARWYTEIQDSLGRRPQESEMIRIRGVLVTDEGNIVQLLVDAWQNPKDAEQYYVFDSTDTRGWWANRKHANRATAIRNALKSILETDRHNHGRGYCTIHIHTTVSGVVETERFRVDVDASAALIYALENTVKAATAIALVVAAATGGGAGIGLLLPLGIIGSIPSIYRLATKIREGTFSLDAETAMELIDVVGSVVGLGQVASGALKLVNLGKTFMVMGLGADGLGALLMAGSLAQQLIDAKSIQPEGARRAQIMRIMSSALFDLGMSKAATALGRLAEHHHRKATGIDAPLLDRADPPTNKHLQSLVGATVPVHVEGELAKGKHPIRFEKDGYGLPSDLKVVLLDSDANPTTVEPHAPGVRAILTIDELSPGVRRLADSVDSLKHAGLAFPEKSRAGAARKAIGEAPANLFKIAEDVASGQMKPEVAQQKVADLKAELLDHQQTLYELAQGEDFVKAQADTEKQAVALGYKPAPPGHYYVAKGEGFDLRRRADTELPQKPVEPPTPKPAPTKPKGKGKPPKQAKGKPPKDKPAAPPPKPTTPATPPKPKRLHRRVPHDPANVMVLATQLLPGVPPAKVRIVRVSSKRKDVRVKPPKFSASGDFEIHAREIATDGEIKAALERHAALDQMRPLGPKNEQPTSKPKTRKLRGSEKNEKRLWSGDEEAAWRGLPPPEDGYHWVWQGDGVAHHNTPLNGGKRRRYRAKTDTIIDAPGQGPPPFDKNATAEDAFGQLGGDSPRPHHEFGRWVKTVTGRNDVLNKLLGLPPKQGLPAPDGSGPVTRDWLVAQIGNPGGQKPGAVEAKLRGLLQHQLDEAIRNIPALRERYKALWDRVGPLNADLADRVVSHRALLDLTDGLAPTEGGHVANAWLLDQPEFGPPGHQREVTIKPEVLAAHGLDATHGRRLDALVVQDSRTKGHETKHGRAVFIRPEPEFSVHNRGQYDVFSKLGGKVIQDKHKAWVKLDDMQYAFTHPEGVKTNADWFAKQLTDGVPVDFVLFDHERGHKKWTADEVQRRMSEEGLTPKALADEIRAFVDGSDWKRKQDLAASKGAQHTHEAYATGPAPADGGPALWDHLAKPESWTPDRREVHEGTLATAHAHARAFADAVEGPPTIFAMRGNTASGKTRAIAGNIPVLEKAVNKTAGLRHRAVNPDNFKLDLREADLDIPLSSTQVHSESSMLASRFEKMLSGLKRSDGQPGSFLIDKRLGPVGDVQRLAQMARDTGRKLELYDIDASLEISLYGVLMRPPGGADPVPSFEVIAKGYVAARDERSAVMAVFMADGSLGTYKVFGTDSKGSKKLVAEVVGGNPRVVDQAQFDSWKTHNADEHASTVAAQLLTPQLVEALTKDLPTQFRDEVRAALEPHVKAGRTWKEAVDLHSQTPPGRR